MKILIATNNPHKSEEIEAILADLPGIEILTLRDLEVVPPEPVEDGATLEENAYIKAREIHEATGLPTLADDTGLEVDALGGAPGVRSARYAGEDATYADNCAKLLEELAARDEAPAAGAARADATRSDAARSDATRSDAMRSDAARSDALRTDATRSDAPRRARFRSVICFVDGSRTLFAEGSVEGEIIREKRGDGGFGYDPLFVPEGETRTFSEMPPAVKNAISHRGRALAHLRRIIEPYLTEASDVQ
jgi:XTP/dITP diphosphohydrolase